MREERIMEALGAIQDRYVVEAAPGAGRRKKRGTRWVAAVLVLLLGAAVFTAPGSAAAAFLKEQVTDFFELLFPPKEVLTTPEGMPEQRPHTAGGQEPDAAVPGFAIYYDPELYELTEEGGRTYLRSIPAAPTREEIRENNAGLLEGLTPEEAEKTVDELLARQEAFDASLPPCELEILHVPQTAPDETADAVREDMRQTWETVSAIQRYEPLACITFRASGGTAWDSPVEEVYFIGDGQTGTYQITLRYFVEAAEGHGARLTAMLQTFEVLRQDMTPPETP